MRTGPRRVPRSRRPPIDLASLFSAAEGQPHRSAAASPPPVTNPFQAPDFGGDDALWLDEAEEAEEV